MLRCSAFDIILVVSNMGFPGGPSGLGGANRDEGESGGEAKLASISGLIGLQIRCPGTLSSEP